MVKFLYFSESAISLFIDKIYGKDFYNLSDIIGNNNSKIVLDRLESSEVNELVEKINNVLFLFEVHREDAGKYYVLFTKQQEAKVKTNTVYKTSETTKFLDVVSEVKLKTLENLDFSYGVVENEEIILEGGDFSGILEELVVNDLYELIPKDKRSFSVERSSEEYTYIFKGKHVGDKLIIEVDKKQNIKLLEVEIREKLEKEYKLKVIACEEECNHKMEESQAQNRKIIEKARSNSIKQKEFFEETIQNILKLAEISKFIEDVSVKIHLISINAAIESSRHGEAGKGFSVIAREIRKLSEDTGNYINMIENEIVKIRNSAAKNIEERSHDDVEVFIDEEIEELTEE